MSVRCRRTPWIPFGAVAAVAGVLISGLALAGGTVAAPASGLGTMPGPEWAFGATHSLFETGRTANGTYSLHAYFGWDTIFSQTNETATVFSVQGQRTSGSAIFVDFCQPRCGAASFTLNFTYRGWEQTMAFANLTTASSVWTPSGATPALGIENASYRATGSVAESETAAVHGLTGSRSAFKYLTIQVAATTAFAFSPSLGLLPSNVSNNETWNATASYRSVGAFAGHYAYMIRGWTGMTNTNSLPFAGNENASGTVEVQGIDLGPYGLDTGATTNQIALRWTGANWNFDVRDGFLLVPAPGDVFGPGVHGWDSVADGATVASTSHVNLVPSGPLGHLGILASSSTYESTASVTGGGALSQFASPGQDTGVVSVQGEPEPVAAAQGSAGCLISGACPASGGPGAPGRDWVFLGLFGGVGAATIAVAIVTARRRVPPTVFPNAPLYPPGASPRVPAGAVGRPAPPAEESEPDPLENLW